MGPLPPKLAEPTHVAGLKHGVIFTESLTGLGALPDTGAFYAMLAPKHVGTLGSEVRAMAIVGQPLANELIERARKHQVADLSLPLQPDLPLTWPGSGVGHHRQPFLKMPFEFNANVGVPFTIYLLDSHTGTHLVPPAYALLAPGGPNLGFAPDVRGWLDDHERKFGKRPTSAITTEQVPLSQTCGTARFLDVRPLIGTTQRSDWPASPLITPKEIQRFESAHGKLLPGEVLVLKSGWSDRYCKPGPEGALCLEDPVNGVSEGWPALSPEAVLYLAERGIRCVATDGPTIGGVDPRQALMTYSLLGARGMVAVEYLTNLEKVPDRAYFLFAPIKIQGGHGGHGRALAIY
jgi:kynurenine formamidase